MRILIIEDDRDMAHMLQRDLQRQGYDVAIAENGLDGLRAFHDNPAGLVILDVALPQMDGRLVCQRLREFTTVPILMMTGKTVTEQDIADALDLGADEYLLKPLRRVEFVARVKALIRRAQLAEPVATGRATAISGYKDDYLSVDLGTRVVCVKGKTVRLTPTEFKLLSMFVRNQGNVLTFQNLLEQVWGAEYTREHHYPRIYVSHLRRKIEPDAKDPHYIRNEYGVGYRFVAQPTSRV